jgi:putative two-component system response regulator
MSDAAIPLTNRSIHWLRVLMGISRRIDQQIDESGSHSAQVARLARATATALGYSSAEAQSIYWAARLHDIGKVAVPPGLLAKCGPLNEREWQIMRLHPTVGANIVEGFRPVAHLAPWIYYHQEKYDGSGYPDGLHGEQIPPPARLLTVADAFDAMTSERCYRPAVSRAFAIRELNAQRGRHFDPQMVTAFIEVLKCSYRKRRRLTGNYGGMD